MAEYKDREHFIPLRKSELVDLLCGKESLSRPEEDLFRHFCRLLAATFHIEYNQRLEQLKGAYSPFDPDTDNLGLTKLRAEEKQRRINDLFSDFGWLMERANYKHLSRHDLAPAIRAASDWGIRMDVDYSVFDRIAMFVRGDVMRKRSRRRWRRMWKQEEGLVPSYQRLVLIMKLRPHRRLGRGVDTENVFLKMFKDIPKLDVNMLLPGARVRFTKFDRSKIGFSLLSGLGMILFKIASELKIFVEGILATPSPLLPWGIAAGTVGYGTRSYFAFQGTKQRYHLTLTQSLYFQNLDSNSGVLFRILDEAEEQECAETILGYYFLWRHGGEQGWTAAELDDHTEAYLEKNVSVKLDFQAGDALAKLERLHLVERNGDRYKILPPARALEVLDRTWNRFFQYKPPANSE